MADKLEMYVLAVGQGNFGLVAHRDNAGKLVQLDLCDCGRTGGKMEKENLLNQMQIARNLMENRAEVIKGDEDVDVDLYLDNIILSHKDSDHINLLNDKYFLKDLTPASMADKRLNGNKLRRTRAISPEGLQAGVTCGEDEDGSSELFLFGADYTTQGGAITVTAASVEYRSEYIVKPKDDKPNDWAGTSTLIYNQDYDVAPECLPKIEDPLHYRVSPDITKYSREGAPQCVHSVLSLWESPENGNITWEVVSEFRLPPQDKKGVALMFSIYLEVSQQNFDSDSAVTAKFVFDLDPYLYGFCHPLELPEDFPVPLPLLWDRSSCDILNKFTCTEFQNLQECVPFEIPNTDPKLDPWINACLQLAGELYDRAFQQMEKELFPKFQLFSTINIDMICGQLFARRGAPGEQLKMAVGKIYMGGLGTMEPHSLADNTTKRIATFCSQEIQPVSGIAEGTGGIRLIQMPLDATKKLAEGSPASDDSYLASFLEIPMTYEEMTQIPLEENSRSIMYIAPDNSGYRVIFPGDATGDTMIFFVKDIVPQLKTKEIILTNTWLSAPHHGAWRTCKESAIFKSESPLGPYLDALSPDYILISAGFPNKHSHPRVEFVQEAIKNLSYRQNVSPHGMLYNDPDKESPWIMLYTDKRIYSTVSAVYTEESPPFGEPCYVNLSIKIDRREVNVTVGDPIQILAPPPKTDICYTDTFEEPEAGAHLPCPDAFPFLFDEPPAAGSFAL